MVPDRPERVTVIVTGEVFHVLKEEHLWSVMLGDLVDFEEERASGVLEAFLLAGDAEGLAGEASAENIMWRDAVQGFGRLCELCDITEGYLTEVHEVRAACVLVPLAREDAGAQDMLSGDAKTANTGKEIYEREYGRRFLFKGRLNLCELGWYFAFAGIRHELPFGKLRVVGFVGKYR